MQKLGFAPSTMGKGAISSGSSKKCRIPVRLHYFGIWELAGLLVLDARY